MIAKRCGDWYLRLGRFVLERDFAYWLQEIPWWVLRCGEMESSPRSRNYNWFGWTFRIYRKDWVVPILNRARMKVHYTL
jgi:hypothetical protein